MTKLERTDVAQQSFNKATQNLTYPKTEPRTQMNVEELLATLNDLLDDGAGDLPVWVYLGNGRDMEVRSVELYEDGIELWS